MDILIATAKFAEDTVKKAVGSKAHTIVLDMDIAAFITPRRLLEALRSKQLQKHYDIIFVPGLVSGDFSRVAEELGSKIYLGPKHAYDLGYVLDFIGEVEFSTKVPACELLADFRKKIALEKVEQLEASCDPLMCIKDIKLGGGSRMKILAEIVDATGMETAALEKRILTFVDRGADMIDLGASLNATPEDVERAIRTARKVTALPISIDTLDNVLLTRAIGTGVDLVLSLNSSNLDEIGPLAARAGVPVVIIPDSYGGLDSLVENIKKAKELGIRKIIADPVLEPIGHDIAGSIVRYHEFHKLLPKIPVFFGAGNVTELLDADSHGANATLCGIAAEVGASILFTPEYSTKTQGSIRELKVASQMIMLALERQSSPKDLGIDLIELKEKRRRTDAVIPSGFKEAKEHRMWKVDPAGSVRIGIVPDDKITGEGLILAEHETSVIVGANAKAVLDTLIDMQLVSTLEHAGYLGRELKKAEIALKFSRSYAQDDEF
ncbi:MAG: dihydropteroate synthase-like protein [Methanomethylovorans sp.]|uniref:dihydropteroate synthase-like protein n=1 Tax=Methanomethylovorans sp. TaxID=2758717 RepID=UPI003C73CF93